MERRASRPRPSGRALRVVLLAIWKILRNLLAQALDRTIVLQLLTDAIRQLRLQEIMGQKQADVKHSLDAKPRRAFLDHAPVQHL